MTVCRCLRDHAGRFFFMEYPQAAVVIMPLQPILQVRQPCHTARSRSSFRRTVVADAPRSCTRRFRSARSSPSSRCIWASWATRTSAASCASTARRVACAAAPHHARADMPLHPHSKRFCWTSCSSSRLWLRTCSRCRPRALASTATSRSVRHPTCHACSDASDALPCAQTTRCGCIWPSRWFTPWGAAWWARRSCCRWWATARTSR